MEQREFTTLTVDITDSIGRIAFATKPAVPLMRTKDHPNSLMRVMGAGITSYADSDLHRDVRVAIADSVALVERMVTEPDFTKGVSAFVEKRLPQWGKRKSDRNKP